MKRTFSIIVITVATVTVYWSVLTEDQKYNTIKFIEKARDGELDFSLLSSSKYFGQGEITNQSKHPDSVSPQVNTDKYSKGVKHNLRSTLSNCRTKDVVQEKTKKFYKWIDGAGNQHFSDAPPKNSSQQLITSSEVKTKKYFSLEIERRYSKHSSQHSKIHSDINQIFKFLENDLKLSQIRPANIKMVLFDDKQKFENFKKVVAADVTWRSTGFYSSKHDLVALYTFDNRDVTLKIARHEAFHAIADKLFGNLPTWINEGLAEVIENMENNTFASQHFYLNENHIKTIRTQGYTANNMKTMLSMPARNWYTKNNTLNYAVSWSVAYFLLSDRENKEFFRSLLNYLSYNYCKKTNAFHFLENNYPGGFSKFFNKWVKWINSEHKKPIYI